ncbi:MAG TPA: family 16 glycosylhydrolase [Polyangiaceae bacterium]|nr:family 16 glycosylhydrolase [Polyangiaceae bacterium]
MLSSTAAHAAVSSAELYTSQSYTYGRVEARARFAAGDGVVSSFFLWKNGSEMTGTFWNELDFEKVGADCHLQTNALFGLPLVDHGRNEGAALNLCNAFHTFAYEWTPDYIAWFIDGTEVRREAGDTAKAYADNATAGMQIRFNIWPGDASFGGNFSPSILPVHEYIDWVQYSTYTDGAFNVAWREDFDGTSAPTGWLVGSWASPKNLSTHSAQNVTFVDGHAVLSLTTDDAVGFKGKIPLDGQPDKNPSDSDDSGGCSVRNPHGASGRSLLFLSGLAFAAVASVRRRARRRGRP